MSYKVVHYFNHPKRSLCQRLTQILIYSYHILNRLVDELKKTNLMPNSEMRFNVARRILIAEIQAITYQQWLPLVLGDEIMHEVRKYLYIHLFSASIAK